MLARGEFVFFSFSLSISFILRVVSFSLIYFMFMTGLLRLQRLWIKEIQAKATGFLYFVLHVAVVT